MRSYSDHLPICGHFHNYMTRYQWPLKPQGLEFSINNCSRSSSHSEQISADACDELSLVLRCICSKICAETVVQYKYIYELHLDQEETYISTALHCAYAQEQGYDTVHIRSPDT